MKKLFSMFLLSLLLITNISFQSASADSLYNKEEFIINDEPWVVR